MPFDKEYFETLLKKHDWTYTYSDDHRWWVRGNEEMKVIQAYIKANGQEAMDLYEVYLNKNFPKGS